MNDLLYADELAEGLRRGRGYVYAMKKHGFQMPGGTATLGDARTWLRERPTFSTTGYYAKSAERVVEPIAPISVSFGG